MGQTKAEILGFVVLAAVAITLGVGVALRPALAVAAIAALVVVVAIALVRSSRVLVTYSVAAIACLVLLPSTATAMFPLGSFYPILGCLGLQLLAFVRAPGPLRRPPYLLWLAGYFAILTVSSLARGQYDAFYLLIGLVAVLQYALVWNLDAPSRQRMVSWVIGLACVEVFVALLEVRRGAGPFLGAAIVMDVGNPFLPGYLRAHGTLGHPLALTMLLATALALLLVATQFSVVKRVILAGLLTFGCVLTGSSTAVALVAIVALGALVVRKSLATSLFACFCLGGAALAVVGYGLLPDVLTSDLTDRTTSHRMNSIRALPNLLTDRDAGSALFGDGITSTSRLYSQGVLIDDGFHVIDNQITTAFASAGLIGMGCLLAFGVAIIARSQSWRWRSVPIAFALMAVSYDLLLWYTSAALFATICALAVRGPDEGASGPPEAADATRDLTATRATSR